MPLVQAYDFPDPEDRWIRLHTVASNLPGDSGGAPIPPPTDRYFQQVWDTTLPGYVTWVSVGSYDTIGAHYPGPGAFGIDTSHYRAIDR
jgi:hypothetical protein